jgi:hypothetical protein
MYAHVAESSRASTAPPLPSEIVEEVVQEEDNMLVEGASDVSHPTVMPEDPTDTVDGRSGELKLDQMKDEVTASSTEPLQESKQLPQIDWLDLPIVKKLDSLHTLMEWQFQNPNRLRTQMKDDDEDAQWVILCLVHISQFLIR